MLIRILWPKIRIKKAEFVEHWYSFLHCNPQNSHNLMIRQAPAIDGKAREFASTDVTAKSLASPGLLAEATE
jgi:hypothetical protein